MSFEDSVSKLLSQTNQLLKNLEDLNLNIDLYVEVHSLQENLTTLEENYNLLQNNLKTLECNTQCNNLNTIEPKGVDDLLIKLLLFKSKSKSNSPIFQENGNNLGQFANSEISSAPSLEELEEDEIQQQQQQQQLQQLQQPSAPPDE
jgi:hypothetical protein